MTKLTDLSQPELDVMLQLAQSKTTSVVLLAAGLWRTTPDWEQFDPYPLLTYVLDGLSARGLCSFRLEYAVSGSYKKGHRVDMPFDIRLTPKGWALMGYPNKTVEVGSRGRHERTPLHPGDPTDYINLAGHTYGGAIEKMTFAEHRVSYPHHIHSYGVRLTMANAATRPKKSTAERLADPRVLEDPNGTGQRGYIRITADMEATVLALRQSMSASTGVSTYADIAQEARLPERTVRYILTDLPRLRRASEGEQEAQRSLKERVYETVQVLGLIKDVPELRRIVGMADSDHDVLHVLHSLHTQGRIDFDERGNGMGTATVINIRLPKKGSKRQDREANDPVPETATEELPEATTPDPHVTAPSAPEQQSEGYPLLDALLDRERKRQDGDNKGMAFVVAAEAIEAIDPDMARELMKKAEAFNTPFPSPIEQEYIRYVATHPAPTEATVEG